MWGSPSGSGSVRQFNRDMRLVFRASPVEPRSRRRLRGPARGGRRAGDAAAVRRAAAELLDAGICDAMTGAADFATANGALAAARSRR